MDKVKLFRRWGKIASIVLLIVLIDELIALFGNYEINALSSGWFWLLVSVKILPTLFIGVPLIYYSWKNN